MAHSAGILCLGTRKDATTFEKGAKNLGFAVPEPIKNPSPTIADLRRFFKSEPEWIYFGGHFVGGELYNDGHSVGITFNEDSVTLVAGDTSEVLEKGSDDFHLDAHCAMILWGGCSVCSRVSTIQTMRALFGPHVLLGFNGLTGWKMVDAMLGGGFIAAGKHFFDRVSGHETDPAAVRDGWMKTAQYGYRNTENETKFRAIDVDGKEWILEKGEIRSARNVP